MRLRDFQKGFYLNSKGGERTAELLFNFSS